MSVTCYNVTKSSRAAVQAYSEGSCNHRTASPRRPAPRRSTTTNKPPSPSELFRTWPSIFLLLHVYVQFFSCFFFFHYTHTRTHTHTSNDRLSNAESMPMSRLWPYGILQLRPTVFFVASTSRLQSTVCVCVPSSF